MERILVVSRPKNTHAMLRSSCPPAVCSRSCAVRWPAAKRAAHLVDGEFDLYSSTRRCRRIRSRAGTARRRRDHRRRYPAREGEIADSVAEKVEDDGVFVVPKPLSRVLFMQALRMTRAARSRLSGLQNENRRLQKRIEDIRLVDGRNACSSSAAECPSRRRTAT